MRVDQTTTCGDIAKVLRDSDIQTVVNNVIAVEVGGADGQRTATEIES